MNPNDEEQGKKVKNIAIRGVDTQLYEVFSRKIQAMGMQMGSAFNKIMQEILKNIDVDFPEMDGSTLKNSLLLPIISIYGKNDVTISRNDLIEAESRLSINGIQSLIFEEDVTKEDFKKYIISIAECGTIRIPKTIPKLLVLSKTSKIEKINYY